MCIARLRSKNRQNREGKRPFPHPFMQKTASSFSERERASLKNRQNTQKIVRKYSKSMQKVGKMEKKKHPKN